jgi:sugar lactone lactonase YvrE
MKAIKYILLVLLVVVITLCAAIYVRYGGGKPYPDVSTAPLLPVSALETVVTFDEPIGNVTVSREGRVFFTVHPESRPEKNRLMEWKDGKAIPFPNAEFQITSLATPLGIAIDANNTLWVVDHGEHATGSPKLIAFDLISNGVKKEIPLGRDVAPLGSFLQDLQVDSKGEMIYIADVSFWRKSPGLVVVNAQSGRAWRALDKHPSVTAENWIVRNQIKDMVFFGGLVALKAGVDGIAITKDDKWIYYAAMAHDGLFRISTDALRDEKLGDIERAAKVERVGTKPLNDGLSADLAGNIYITDVEHQSIVRAAPDGKLATVIRSEKIRWADALSYGPDGWLYIADSAIPEQMLQSKAHIKSKAPYYIYRFKPGVEGVPGQ